MPTYEYQCNACGHALEAFQRMADAPLTDCPACGKPMLEKKISASGFQLKGTGWYETDFKGKPKKKPEGEAASPAPSPEVKTEKPAAAATPAKSGSGDST
ncbi:MAG: zinc ribbon domain-containing protein [Gammaproteobacteria bacterium]|nr:zinc ribbon domain-containing protein [Gammaproteobacteria bacterium]